MLPLQQKKEKAIDMPWLCPGQFQKGHEVLSVDIRRCRVRSDNDNKNHSEEKNLFFL
jgi:hypothetical protein